MGLLSEFKSRNAAQLPDLRQANVNRLAALRDQLAEREVRLAGAEGEIASMRDHAWWRRKCAMNRMPSR